MSQDASGNQGEVDLPALLQQLERWRHFGAYKLENRVDVLFGVFLPSILGHAVGVQLKPEIIPEFPFPQEILLGTKDGSKATYRCDRIDFAAISNDGSQLFLVELKTDTASVRDAQLEKMLEVCKERNIGSQSPAMAQEWVETLLDVAKPAHTTQTRKYLYILQVLRNWGLVGSLEEVHKFGWAETRTGLTEALNQAKPAQHEEALDHFKDIELVPVLIAPEKDAQLRDPLRQIDFREAAEALNGLPGEGAQTFAYCLEQWQRNPAEEPPNAP